MKLKFNACPKCRGDLEIRRDIYGMFVNCFQCGLQRDLDAPSQAIEFAEPEPAQVATSAFDAREELLKAA